MEYWIKKGGVACRKKKKSQMGGEVKHLPKKKGSGGTIEQQGIHDGQEAPKAGGCGDVFWGGVVGERGEEVDEITWKEKKIVPHIRPRKRNW